MKNSKYSENENISYAEYIAESIYAEYIAESIDNNISYAEYIAENNPETPEQKAERIREERRKKLERIWK